MRRTRPIPGRSRPEASRSRLVWRLWGNRWLRLGVVAALVLLAVAPFAVSWLVCRFTHSSTDDAFVETHVVNIAPQAVSGHLVRYQVQEHDVVAAGQLLAEIDPVPYREQVALLEAKLGVAESQLAAAQTSLERLQAQVPREIEVAQLALAAAKAEQARDDKTLQFTTEDTEKGIHEAQSDLDAARARLVLAEEDYKRYAMLFAKEAATQRQSQEATRTDQTSQAEVKASEARLGRALAGEKKVEAVRQAAAAAAHQAQRADKALEVALTRRLEITEAERQVEVKRQQVGDGRSRRATVCAWTSSPSASRSTAGSCGSTRPPAPTSRWCRETSLPASSPTWCSACRCASWSRRTSAGRTCARGCP
jgi:membrane fusion protein, multidrug efflux system